MILMCYSNYSISWCYNHAGIKLPNPRWTLNYHFRDRKVNRDKLALITTVFVDTRLWKTKHPPKRFQNFRQSCVLLLTDRIEIHQSQPDSMTYRRLESHTSGCNWWISIRSVNNKQDWRKFWKRFHGCFVFQSRVSTKTVVIVSEV